MAGFDAEVIKPPRSAAFHLIREYGGVHAEQRATETIYRTAGRDKQNERYWRAVRDHIRKELSRGFKVGDRVQPAYQADPQRRTLAVGTITALIALGSRSNMATVCWDDGNSRNINVRDLARAGVPEEDNHV